MIGGSASSHMALGLPVSCEVLGMPVRGGKIVKLADAKLPEKKSLDGLDLPPIVAVSGTCMESGKTLFLSEVTQELSKRGLSIAGGKLTGIACLRDLISMEDHGASFTASFLDAGLSSTAGVDGPALVKVARTVIAHLASFRPDLLVLELGDGVIGDYGVLDILLDPEIRGKISMHAFCAGDLVGAWGGERFLREHGIPVDIFSGPATDNAVGVEYIEKAFGKRAINAHRNPEDVASAVLLTSREDEGVTMTPAMPAQSPARNEDRIGVGVIGGSGYIGAELLRYLVVDPRVGLRWVTANTKVGEPIGALLPNLRGFVEGAFVSLEEASSRIGEVRVILREPAPQRVPDGDPVARGEGPGAVFIDMAGDFRTNDPAGYRKHYGEDHRAPDWLSRFVYGFTEYARERLREAKLIANPGCFASALDLSLAPLAAEGKLAGDVFMTGITGSSGSGNKPSQTTHHPERTTNVRAYKPLAHQHLLEVEAFLKTLTRSDFRLHFVPQSGPFARGILHHALHAGHRGGGARAHLHARLRRVEADLGDAGIAGPPLGPGNAADGDRVRRRREPGSGLLRARQPRQGRGGPGDPEHEPRARARGDGRPSTCPEASCERLRGNRP